MKRLVAGVGLTLFGAVLAVSGCKKGDGGPRKGFVAATDSPVVVRGGSVTVRTPYDVSSPATWSQPNTATYPWVWEVSLPYLPNYLELDGVNTTPTSSSSPVDVPVTGITTNWIVAFSFRNVQGGEDRKTKFELCTQWAPPADSSSGCQASGTLQQTLFMVGDLDVNLSPKHTSTNNPGAPQFKDDLVEPDRIGKRFDIFCGGDSDVHSRCNHIHEVTIYPQTISGTTYPTYHCVYGACDIGMYHQ